MAKYITVHRLKTDGSITENEISPLSQKEITVFEKC